MNDRGVKTFIDWLFDNDSDLNKNSKINVPDERIGTSYHFSDHIINIIFPVSVTGRKKGHAVLEYDTQY
jgi:hypothetical protein